MSDVTGSHAGLLSLARTVAWQAAENVRTSRPRGRVAVAATKSSATDPVTAVDTATEELIRSAIRAARPDDGFVGEEGAHRESTSGVSWVVDPIDGTVNFVYGIPAYAVSIGVEVDGLTVAGVVRNVASGEEYSAVLGGGAWCALGVGEPRRLQVVDGVDLAQALVGTGFGYDPARRVEQATALLSLVPQVRDVRRIGSAALDLCSVADGRLDAYVEQGLRAWDRCAGVLIVRAAGGVVTGLDGGEPDQRLVVAAAPSLHERFLRAVIACGF